MLRAFAVVAAFFITLSSCGPAGAATAIDFTFDVDNSSVTITDQSGGGLTCFFTSCGVEAALAPGFGSPPTFALEEGQSNTFDFIEFTAGGSTFVGRSFEISATLAFSSPASATTTSDGSGRSFFIAGTITGGVLSWDDVPAFITLADGNEISIDFQDGLTILPLANSIITTATVEALSVTAVPLPAAFWLLISGLGLIGLFDRRWRTIAT